MSRITTITAIIAFFAAIPAQAADIYAEYVRNYDGDTVTVDLVDLRDIDLDGTTRRSGTILGSASLALIPLRSAVSAQRKRSSQKKQKPW